VAPRTADLWLRPVCGGRGPLPQRHRTSISSSGHDYVPHRAIALDLTAAPFHLGQLHGTPGALHCGSQRKSAELSQRLDLHMAWPEALLPELNLWTQSRKLGALYRQLCHIRSFWPQPRSGPRSPDLGAFQPEHRVCVTCRAAHLASRSRPKYSFKERTVQAGHTPLDADGNTAVLPTPSEEPRQVSVRHSGSCLGDRSSPAGWP
jgi:hypothetical protein